MSDPAPDAAPVRLALEAAEGCDLDAIGWLIGAGVTPPIASAFYGDGVTLYRPGRFEADDTVEFLVIRLQPRPMRVRWLERHPLHTQTFVPLGGKPFCMVVAAPTGDDLPEPPDVRAIRFDGTKGFCLRKGAWHEVPFAIQPDTDVLVVLRRDTTASLRQGGDEAFGADLDKRDVARRQGVVYEAGQE